MPLYVVAFPRFADADRGRIDELRARFDPAHRLVRPHITLVFATDRLTVDALTAHVTAVAESFVPFVPSFRRTAVVEDAFSKANDVFLVPSEGFAEIAALHDALYSGPLASELRLDIPFLPHITVARFGSEDDARQTAASLEAVPLAIRAEVDHLDVLIASGDAIRSGKTIPLKNRRST